MVCTECDPAAKDWRQTSKPFPESSVHTIRTALRVTLGGDR